MGLTGKLTRPQRATAALLTAGGMAACAGVSGLAGHAGAAGTDVTITAKGDQQAGYWDKGTDTPVQISVGDSVVWAFEGGGHNVASPPAPHAGGENDPRWDPYVYPPGAFTTAPAGAASDRYTFYQKGTYVFVCEFHVGQMTGTIEVTGTDLPTPTPSSTPTVTTTPDPSPEPTVSPSGTPAPPVDDHTSTPPPTPAADTTKPALGSLKATAARRAAKVRFSLSEDATVTIVVRKRGQQKALRTLTLQARAGTRTIVVRSSKLRKGRYTVALTARDAMGNTSTAASVALRIRK